MKLVSVHVGLARAVVWKGETVTTGIFKEPVEGRLMLRVLNLDGDGQADLSVHGGVHKAAYVYPAHHYDFWRNELPGMTLPYGMFGENFTVVGADEASVNIGDQFRIGSARVVVTQPRLPCSKLGIKFGRSDIIRRFLASGRTGFYLAVLQEGEVGVGDSMESISRDENKITVADIVRLYTYDENDFEMMQRATRVQALPASWRDYFQHQIDDASKKDSR